MAVEQVVFHSDWYDTLISKTNEKDVLRDQFQNIVKEQKLQSCLEIGLGTSPHFSEGIAPLVSRYVILEKEEFTGALPDKVTYIQEDWEKAELTETFDCIIASHVIYYFHDKARAVQKIIHSLTDKGTAIFVVNGRDGDYGPLKEFFADLIGEDVVFTYDEVHVLLKDYELKEISIPTTITFTDYDELYETLKLSFDKYPTEYLEHKTAVVRYLSESIRSGTFTINQKLLVVEKKQRTWDALLKHPTHTYELEAGVSLTIHDGVFTPDPAALSYSTQLILQHLPVLEGKRVLDMGCGAGVLAISAALHGASEVIAADISDLAIQNTIENVERLHLEEKVRVVQSDLFERVEGEFDVIFANMPIRDELWKIEDGHTLIGIEKLVSQAKHYVRKGGSLLISWASFADLQKLLDICHHLGASSHVITQSMYGYDWYLVTLTFN